MMRVIQTAAKLIGVRGWLAMAALGAVPSMALAGGRGFDDGDRGDHGGFRIGIDLPVVVIGGDHYRDHEPVYCPPPPTCDVRETQVWVDPVYRTVNDRQWVDPVYRTVCDRVWVEPAVQSRCDRVWVPDRYEWRDVCEETYGYRRIVRTRVLVEAAHYEERPAVNVLVPGHFEDVKRQELVCDGHYQTVEHQELVCAGHYETRVSREVIEHRFDDRPGVRVEFRLPLR